MELISHEQRKRAIKSQYMEAKLAFQTPRRCSLYEDKTLYAGVEPKQARKSIVLADYSVGEAP